jgi:NAD(P)-dependent dehydrogenase (short-subunit alcohol dehydrogenase family)
LINSKYAGTEKKIILWRKTLTDKNELFDISGMVIAITGGAGVLGSAMAQHLARAGAHPAILDLNCALPEPIKKQFHDQGTDYLISSCDVLQAESIRKALEVILEKYGKVDALINGAGGNHSKATTSAEMTFFDISAEAFEGVTKLNLMGTVLPCQIFGQYFAKQKTGNIVNISSMNAFRPLTRIPAYSAAKAAVSNFTQWLAVHMAQNYSPQIRVNAIAPGFFLTDQNRFLLTDEASGALTPRGKTIIEHTSMGRFGDPADLFGTLHWLLAPASAFITGIVVPVDGGFSAYSGV